MAWALGFIITWAVLSIPFGVLFGKMIAFGQRE